jgi:hypothetical protein
MLKHRERRVARRDEVTSVFEFEAARKALVLRAHRYGRVSQILLRRSFRSPIRKIA